MKQVIKTFKRTDGEKRIAILRMEIDYELATLHEAMVAEDYSTIAECKNNLENFRQELVRLEG